MREPYGNWLNRNRHLARKYPKMLVKIAAQGRIGTQRVSSGMIYTELK